MRSRKYSVCPICNKEISNSNIKKHIESHEKHPEYHKDPVWAVKHEGLLCQYCGKECKNYNSLCNHERLCNENPHRQISSNGLAEYNSKLKSGEIEIWNKGLTEQTDSRVKKYADSLRARIAEGTIVYNATPVENKTSKTYKYGTYSNIYCDSSWELAFVIYCVDHDMHITRNTVYYEYVDSEGKCRRFFPDFLVDNVLYEIKGGYDLFADYKRACIPDDVEFVWIDDAKIKFYLDYAEETYGKDFITLYDPAKPSWMNRK